MIYEQHFLELALSRTIKNNKDSLEQAYSLKFPLSWSFKVRVFVVAVFFVIVYRFLLHIVRRGVRYLLSKLKEEHNNAPTSFVGSKTYVTTSRISKSSHCGTTPRERRSL